MSSTSYIKISRLSSLALTNYSFENGQNPHGCSCFSYMPIEVAVVGNDNQCTVEHVGYCCCEAFLVADRLATVMGLRIYDDCNVL